VAFSTLLLGQFVLILVERSPSVALWRTGATRPTRIVWAVGAAFVGTILFGTYVEPTADLL
jgi:hypothetical protein